MHRYVLITTMPLCVDSCTPVSMKMIVNTSSSLINHLSSLCESDEEKAKKVAKQIFYLCLMSQRNLTAEEMKKFLDDSFGILKNY